MRWARGIIKRMPPAAAPADPSVVEPDPRLVLAALAAGMIVAAMLTPSQGQAAATPNTHASLVDAAR
jgi:hypothetical protein